jgi:hypothetical protein
MAKLPFHCVLALVVLGAGVSAAQAGEEEQAALCRDDVMRLCMTSIPDRGRIVSCMKAQRASLSPDCRAVFDAGSRGDDARRSASLR